MEKHERIVKEVCNYYGISETYLNTRKRDRDIVTPRQMTHLLLRENTRMSLTKIGRFVGTFPHDVVLHSIEAITNLMEFNKEIRGDYINLTEIINKPVVFGKNDSLTRRMKYSFYKRNTK